MENKNQIDTIIKQMKVLELRNSEIFKEIEKLNIRIASLEKGKSDVEQNTSNTKRIERLEREVADLKRDSHSHFYGS